MPNARAIALPASSGAVIGTGCSYYGFSVYNTSASAGATVLLYDGSNASGTLIDTITLLAGESAREDYVNPVRVTGIYATITGSVTGTVRIG